MPEVDIAPKTKQIRLRPLSDRTLIRPDVPESQTKGGIILPGAAQEKPQSGIVVAIGPGRSLENGTVEPMPYGVGDHVLYGRYSGLAVQGDNEEFVCLRVSEIIAIIDPE